VPRDEIRNIATRWLENWEHDRGLVWVAWNRECLRFLMDDVTREELLATADDHGALILSARFYIAARELMLGNKDAAILELSQGYDKDWGLTFYGAMWCECLLDVLDAEGQNRDSQLRNGSPIPSIADRPEFLNDE
jgi:hypothetical protein